jgi:hypothetical protein
VPKRELSELERAQEAATVASAFLMVAQEAKELGEKDITVMALKRARNILRRRLIEEDDHDNV